MRLFVLLSLVTAAIVGGSCAPVARPAAPVVTPTGVRFVLVRASARSVAVAGSFNRWSATAHLLTRTARGAWSITIPLPAGEHLFMFVVDGSEWITPPLAEDYVDDGFGAKNGIVVVRAPERR